MHLLEYLKGSKNNLLDNCSKHFKYCNYHNKMRKWLVKQKDINIDQKREILIITRGLKNKVHFSKR